MQTFGKIFISLFAAAMLFAGNVWAAEEQTPWQSGQGGWVMKNLNWPGYNTGYEFVANADGKVVKLGGLFNGTKKVRLYDSAGNILRQAWVRGNNNWSYAAIEPVALTAGQSYTVAVETGWFGSSMSYGVGFPNFPLPVGDITLKRGVFGFGSSKPRWELWGQMWGQADLAFVADSNVPPLPADPLLVTGEFPASPIYINAMLGTGTPEPTLVGVYLNIQNVSPEPYSFSFSTTQQFDIVLMNGSGGVVKRWSDDKVFMQTFSSKTLSPGESWYLGDSLALDTSVSAGNYLLRIELTPIPGGPPVYAEQPVQILWAW